MRIYIVRHGETEENVLGIIQGWNDTHCNATGLAQAQIVAKRLAHTTFTKLISSDLSRCQETSATIRQLQPPTLPYYTSKGLRERNLGRRQGLTRARSQELAKEEGVPVSALEAESLEVFKKRAWAYWTTEIETLANTAAPEDNLLIVSHGGFIYALIGMLQHHNYTMTEPGKLQYARAHVSNCSVTVVRIEHGTKHIELFADADTEAHLTVASEGLADLLKPGET